MALVAGVGIVHVARHIIVLIVHFVSTVTGETREDREVSRIRVAIRAGIPLIAMVAGKDREVQAVMLREVRTLPGPGVVTDLAILRKAGRLMVGIIGAVVVIAVAGPAIGRGTGETVGMTLLAIQASVRTGQSPELIVVCDRAFPGLRAVTILAVG